jgi:hypothetical protein
VIYKYNKKNIVNLTLFVQENPNNDFYITSDNRRYVINDYKTLKKLLKYSDFILVSEEDGEINGILVVWTATGGDKKRKYIKINANRNITDKLLTVLLWNIYEEMYIKINKNSDLIDIFRSKGFDFFHDRGQEMLLRRTKWIIR